MPSFQLLDMLAMLKTQGEPNFCKEQTLSFKCIAPILKDISSYTCQRFYLLVTIDATHLKKHVAFLEVNEVYDTTCENNYVELHY
jgi:hypothetical protein